MRIAPLAELALLSFGCTVTPTPPAPLPYTPVAAVGTPASAAPTPAASTLGVLLPSGRRVDCAMEKVYMDRLLLDLNDRYNALELRARDQAAAIGSTAGLNAQLADLESQRDAEIAKMRALYARECPGAQ